MAHGPVPLLLHYQNIPALQHWTKDRAGLASNKSQPDRVLERIDDLVKSYGRTKNSAKHSYLLGELYFSTKYWIRNVKPALTQKQQAAPVHALFDCVERRLARLFKCDLRMVGAKLQKYYCCCENAHGIFCDEYDIPHSFDVRGETEKFKLYFVNGLAMWNRWWEQSTGGLVPVDTAEARKRATFGTSSLRPDAAFFVMNRYRDMYAAPHFSQNADYPMYHSSIPKGQAVQFAGTIVIKGGQIKEIRNDSGHYKPGNDYMLNVLEHLKTVNARGFDEIELFDHKDDRLGTAQDAMEYEFKEKGWKGIKERGKDQRNAMIDMAAAIKGRERGKRLKELTPKHGRDKALEMIFADRFDVMRGGLPGSPHLWDETWRDVLKSLRAFYSTESGIPDAEELGRWLEGKEAGYKLHAPAPPRPSTGH